MRRAAVTALAAGALLAPAAAEGAQIDRYAAVAQEAYAIACTPTITWADLEPGRAGEATEPCAISLDWEEWKQRTPSQRCALRVHEQGHLAGAEHSADPLNVMHPTASTHHGCVRFDRERDRLDALAGAIRDVREDIGWAREDARYWRPRARSRYRRTRARIRRLERRHRRLTRAHRRLAQLTA